MQALNVTESQSGAEVGDVGSKPLKGACMPFHSSIVVAQLFSFFVDHSLTHSLLHLHLIYTNGLLTFCSSKEKHCEAAANGDQQRLLFWDLSSPVWPAILPWSVGAVYPLLLFLSHILLNIPPQFFTIFFLTFFSLDFFLVTEHLSS